MLTIGLASTKRPLAFDAICHSSAFVNVLQAVTKTAHDVLGAMLPMDAQGCYAWANSLDPEETDAEAERIFSLVEGAGLSLRLL